LSINRLSKESFVAALPMSSENRRDVTARGRGSYSD